MNSSNKYNTLLGHIYANTKNMAWILVVLLGLWALKTYFYVSNNKDYTPEQMRAVTTEFTKAIEPLQGQTAWPNTNIQDTVFIDGYKRLQQCRKPNKIYSFFNERFPSFFDDKYEVYNDFLRKGTSVNRALLALNQRGYLQHQYQLNFDTVLSISCEFSLRDTNIAFASLANEANLKSLDWAEKKIRRFDIQIPPKLGYASLPKQWNVTENPWRGYDGCVYLANTPTAAELANKAVKPVSLIVLDSDNAKRKELCQSKEMYGAAKTNIKIEDTQQQIVTANEFNAQYGSQLIEFKNLSGNVPKITKDGKNYYTINLHGIDVPVGWNSQLTINPQTQILAKRIANCVTRLTPPEKFNTECAPLINPVLNEMTTLQEGALVRMVGIAVVDVESMQVEALASATSPCFQSDYGVVHKNGCMPIPDTWKKQLSPESAQVNQAIDGQYQPASTVKIMQGLAMLRAFPGIFNSAENRARVTKIMAKSDTEAVINILACQDSLSTNYANHCPGLSAFQKAANDLGWNNNCSTSSARCGKSDILRAEPLNKTKLEHISFLGRVMTTGNNKEISLLNGLDSISPQSYVARKRDNRNTWQGNVGRNALLDNSINESLGQGNALATPLGVASMTARLLSIANGNQPLHNAVVLSKEPWTVKGKGIDIETKENASETPSQNNNLTEDEAKTVVSLFTAGHSRADGTSASICKKIYGGSCGAVVDGYTLMTKTGTPEFKITTITGLNNECRPRSIAQHDQIKNGKVVQTSERVINSTHHDCTHRPIRWFLLGTQKNGKWTKVIAVVSERNWTTATGKLDETNTSVQINFMLMKQLNAAGQL